MGLLSWLGLREDVPPSDPSTALTIPRRSATTRVSVSDALGLSMVYRAVQIHAIAAKQLSIGTYRGDEQISSPLFIRKPTIDQPRSAFIETAVVSLATNGNAYWRIHRSPDTERVSHLVALNPLDVVVNTNRAGETIGYQYRGARLDQYEVKHLKLLRVPGTPYGLGPIQAAQHELRGALDLRDYSTNWFQDSAVPTGTLTTDQVLSPDQAEQNKARFTESQAGRRGVAVLGNGLTYSAVYLSPRDAQFLESQQFTVTEMARLFGVPSSLMLAQVEGSTNTYQNVAQDWLGYTRFALMAYLIEIEDAFTSLLPGDQQAKFNVEALLRTDITTRYTAHKIAIEAEFMSIDEVRAIENLPPREQESTSA